MDLHFRLPVYVEHFAVLRASGLEIELQADPFGALRDGVARLPTEMIDRPDQNVAQAAIFTVDAPALGLRRAAALNSRSQLHLLDPHLPVDSTAS